MPSPDESPEIDQSTLDSIASSFDYRLYKFYLLDSKRATPLVKVFKHIADLRGGEKNLLDEDYLYLTLLLESLS